MTAGLNIFAAACLYKVYSLCRTGRVGVIAILVTIAFPAIAFVGHRLGERVELHKSMLAYTGTYTIDGDKVVHHTDVAAWNNARIGSDQVRFFKLDGDRLTLFTERNKRPIDGSEGFGVLEFDRVR